MIVGAGLKLKFEARPRHPSLRKNEENLSKIPSDPKRNKPKIQVVRKISNGPK